MQGQMYTASVGAVAVTALQDFFQLLASATVPIIVHSVRLGQSSDAGDSEAEMLRVALGTADMTVNGSGGSTTTPASHSPGSPAAVTVAETNNTTQATVNTVIYEDVFNVQAGYLWVGTPEERILVLPTEAFIVELPAAPGDSLTMSGSVTFQELK